MHICADPVKIPGITIPEEEFQTLVEELFHRYDFDNSGTINDSTEHAQLTLNILYKLNGSASRDSNIAVDEIERICNLVPFTSAEDAWSKEQYIRWFAATFHVSFGAPRSA